jgi:Reverse transcriptase (RNA-dependent DNA polymerase)
MKRGIKEFGDAGIDAVLQEMKQLHDRKVIAPKHEKELSPEEKRAALQYLMFLSEKRNGTIKGRGCADGRKQRPYTTKEESSSPTVAIESVLLSCTIDAHEGRDVGTIDIPGAFMQADAEDVVHMKLEGTMAELLVRLDPKMYKKYVMFVNGKMVLYVELKKALYGTLKAAMLFWKKLTATLKSWGFEVNPYDWCVVNKTINGKQCTILWHVDDLKISHVDPQVVTDIINLVKKEFAKEAPLTETRGKIHDYLGMTLDFSSPGEAKIRMDDYIQGVLNECPDDMDGISVTPAPNH